MVSIGSIVTHPAWLRITHWLNAIAALVMVFSGWRIYNASPIFSFTFPESLTMGGWLGGALLWHFAAMWLLFLNGLLYLAFNIFSGRIRVKFFPLSIRAFFADILAALRGQLAHDDLAHYNMVQKFAYLFVIVDIAVSIVSGLAVWKSVQFPQLRALMGGFDAARIVHFIAMAALMLFFIVHIIMVALVPRTLVAMLRGRA